MKRPEDSLGWPLLTPREKQVLVAHGYTVVSSGIGSEIAYTTHLDNQGRLQPDEARMARQVLDGLLPKGDPIFRKSPWGKRKR